MRPNMNTFRVDIPECGIKILRTLGSTKNRAVQEYLGIISMN